MTLRKQQAEFSLAVGKLILHAYSLGYELSFGDAWAKLGKGRLHRIKSKHYDRLAIDLNLFKHDEFLTTTNDHEPLGIFWESLGGTWGGRFNDGNHYSWGE